MRAHEPDDKGCRPDVTLLNTVNSCHSGREVGLRGKRKSRTFFRLPWGSGEVVIGAARQRWQMAGMRARRPVAATAPQAAMATTRKRNLRVDYHS